MREKKKHWRSIVGKDFALCGYGNGVKFANMKRKVTCKNCLRSMGEKV